MASHVFIHHTAFLQHVALNFYGKFFDCVYFFVKSAENDTSIPCSLFSQGMDNYLTDLNV